VTFSVEKEARFSVRIPFPVIWACGSGKQWQQKKEKKRKKEKKEAQFLSTSVIIHKRPKKKNEQICRRKFAQSGHLGLGSYVDVYVKKN
jgi:hypothetical protein